MSPRKCCQIVLTFLFASLIRHDCRADGESPAPPPMKISAVNEEVPYLPPALRIYVTIGTNKFAFLVPPGCRMSESSTNKITFAAADLSFYMTFRVVGPVPEKNADLNPDTCRSMALSGHSDTIVTQEFSAPAADHTGPAFDLRWTGLARLSLRTGRLYPVRKMDRGVYRAIEHRPFCRGPIRPQFSDAEFPRQRRRQARSESSLRPNLSAVPKHFGSTPGRKATKQYACARASFLTPLLAEKKPATSAGTSMKLGPDAP